MTLPATKPPAVVSITHVALDHVDVVFDQALTPFGSSGAGGWALTLLGEARTVTGRSTTAANRVSIAFDEILLPPEAGTLSYTAVPADVLALDGTPALPFSLTVPYP